MTRSIMWFRRDLRLADNPALSAGIERGEVVPVFVIDPKLLQSERVGEKRIAWLVANLRALDAALRERGSQLIVRRGDPAKVLWQLAQETHSTQMLFNLDLTPYARQRDRRVALELEQNGLSVEAFDDVTLHQPEDVVTMTGRPYQVFTAFKRAWLALPKPSAGEISTVPETLAVSLPPVESLPLDFGEVAIDLPAAGEAAAINRLNDFLDETVFGYAEGRNLLDRAATSFLSPYLRFGAISIRQAYWGAQAAIDLAEDAAAKAGAESWLNELIWREFYMALLYHFPHTIQRPLREHYTNFAWLDDEAAFAAWCEGRTGYPVVDAAMRCLNATGWLHNRARMIVASFLTKDLLIDWRKGEQYFMQQLIDGDSASNAGGWQWAAGVGADAQPFFRVFNPTLQGQRFDPDGTFVRQWLPELARVPDRLVHEPWKMTSLEQREAQCLIGQAYPAPIIDHHYARNRALQHYRISNVKVSV
ncbi:MAG: deoxyribodipyrimidine photo-lyase [Thermoflexales bacterium]|nr:deoxyribodipyrimidine photo-lyase [Thermoflexales bacterium]